MRIPHTVWLKFSLQRWISWSLHYSQMMHNPTWEKWGLRAKAACSPFPLSTAWNKGNSLPEQLSHLLTAGNKQTQCFGYMEQAKMPYSLHRENLATGPFGDQEAQHQPPTCPPELFFFQSFAKMSEWYNLYLKEWQNCWNELSCLDLQGTGYQKWESFAKSNYMD